MFTVGKKNLFFERVRTDVYYSRKQVSVGQEHCDECRRQLQSNVGTRAAASALGKRMGSKPQETSRKQTASIPDIEHICLVRAEVAKRL